MHVLSRSGIDLVTKTGLKHEQALQRQSIDWPVHHMVHITSRPYVPCHLKGMCVAMTMESHVHLEHHWVTVCLKQIKWMGPSGNFVRFWCGKCITSVTNLLHLELVFLLWQKIILSGSLLKGLCLFSSYGKIVAISYSSVLSGETS
jgi:hypothetical protein